MDKWQRDAILCFRLRHAAYERGHVETALNRALTDAEWARVEAAHRAGVQHMDEVLITEGLLTVAEPPPWDPTLPAAPEGARWARLRGHFRLHLWRDEAGRVRRDCALWRNDGADLRSATVKSRPCSACLARAQKRT